MVPERILLFIPMYNCARQIGRVIGQLTPDITALLSEVIVVDNGSTDGGREVAAQALKPLPNLPSKVLLNDDNYGLGGSHKTAFLYALEHGFDYVIVLHGDDQGAIADLAPHLQAGAHRDVDCLLGARFMHGSRLSGYSPVRTFGNHVFNALFSVAAGRMLYDLGAGLNLYRVSALADRNFLKCSNDLTFNYHMILRTVAARWRMRFFPLEWREDDQVSNVKLVRQSLRTLAIVGEYAFARRAFLERDHSCRPGEPYTASAVNDGQAAESIS